MMFRKGFFGRRGAPAIGIVRCPGSGSPIFGGGGGGRRGLIGLGCCRYVGKKFPKPIATPPLRSVGCPALVVRRLPASGRAPGESAIRRRIFASALLSRRRFECVGSRDLRDGRR